MAATVKVPSNADQAHEMRKALATYHKNLLEEARKFLASSSHTAYAEGLQKLLDSGIDPATPTGGNLTRMISNMGVMKDQVERELASIEQLINPTPQVGPGPGPGPAIAVQPPDLPL